MHMAVFFILVFILVDVSNFIIKCMAIADMAESKPR
jgi:hypothetical protein